MERLRAYYALTKPGIIKGNAVHVVAGVLLASMFVVDWSVLIGAVIGTSLIIASACVANNYMDRGIDAKMNRTKNRPSVTGIVSARSAGMFASVLALIGIYTLFTFTNPIIVIIGAIAYLMYVLVYGYAKRTTVHSTLIGAIPGALPAMAGYVAVSGQVTIGAWVLFLLVFAWQMPHFYAISIFRKAEYRSAGIPVLGAVRPFDVVRRTMFAYIVLYIVAITALIYFGIVGAPAGLLLLTGAAYWVYVFMTTTRDDESKWARSVFGASLILTLVLLVACLLNVFMPPMA